MRGIEGEQVLLRIILSESRNHDREPLFRLEQLRAEGLSGTTAMKGIADFGHDRGIDTFMLEVVAEGLPIVLEVVDTPKVDALMGDGGVFVAERAHVIRYGQKRPSVAET